MAEGVSTLPPRRSSHPRTELPPHEQTAHEAAPDQWQFWATLKLAFILKHESESWSCLGGDAWVNFSPLLQAELCQSYRMVLGTVQEEILLQTICPILSTTLWALISTYLEKLLTGGASNSGNGQVVPRKGKLWTNALSLSRKSSPVSVSSLEPKKCQPIWPVFQFTSSHYANQIQDDALSHPDKKQALVLANREKVVGS